MADIRIRTGTPADAPMLAELGARTFRDAFAADNRPEDMALYLGRTYGVAQQTAELTNAGIVTLVAQVDGCPAGFAQLRAGQPPGCVLGADPLEVWRFYVDRSWHGMGVAQALMAAVRREAVARGGRTLWLAVWERNERAKGFYRKCGFLDVGSQPFILGEDRQTDLVMVSDLAQAIIEATT
jgi:ribosomal protein S18 acetylase RimI-like enzyme